MTTITAIFHCNIVTLGPHKHEPIIIVGSMQSLQFEKVVDIYLIMASPILLI
jgi:hypothetical protein